jgi:vesicle-fusing ATPase
MVQALLTLVQTPPPKGHRLLILATTSQLSVMEQLDITTAFDRQIRVPAVQSYEELGYVLAESGVFGDDGYRVQEVLQKVREYAPEGDDRIGVGVKTILSTAETAKLSSDPPSWFAEQIAEQIARYKYSGR